MRWRFLMSGVAAAAVLAGTSCNGDDEGTGLDDDVAPEVDIQVPEDGQTVNSQPPFRIAVSDAGSGVFCSSVRATINGTDFSQHFRTGCNEDAGLVQTQGQIRLNEGSNRLQFTIGDRAGNQTTESRTFTVVEGPCLPPICPAPPPAARVPPPLHD